MSRSYQDLADVFKGLSHPTRLEILDLLREGEMCVCHIEAALKKRQAYISQQLTALREAGLVESRRDGLKIYYRLAHAYLEDLLTLTLGTTRQASLQAIPGCVCPHCTTILIAHIP